MRRRRDSHGVQLQLHRRRIQAHQLEGRRHLGRGHRPPAGGVGLAGVLLISEQRLDNTYRPRVEWANLKYQVTPELALRVGRIALPMFLTADYRKVGYAYPWVRPPVEGYGSLPISSSDGVDATTAPARGPDGRERERARELES